MPINTPIFQPQVNGGQVADIGNYDFAPSFIKGYEAGRILAGVPQQMDALKIAQQQQTLEQEAEQFPRSIKLLDEQIMNAPVQRSRFITDILGEPGIVTNADTGPVVPVGNSPMALTQQFAAPEGGGQVPSDAVSVGLPGLPGVARSPSLRVKEEIDEDKRREDRMLALLKLTNQGKIDAATAKLNVPVDPAALKGAVDYYKTTGSLPSFGMGQSAMRNAFYAELGNEGKGAIQEGQENKAVRTGMTSAYRNQQTIYQAEKTALGTLDKQLDLARDISARVDRSGSPVLNKYLLYLKGQVAGDADTALLDNIVTTSSYEFAKILSGGAASIAGVTVSSADDAKRILNSAMEKGQLDAVAEMMKQEGNFRLDARLKTINELRDGLGDIGSDKKDEKISTPSFKPNYRYRDKSTGEIFETDAQGNRK